MRHFQIYVQRAREDAYSGRGLRVAVSCTRKMNTKNLFLAKYLLGDSSFFNFDQY